jgi:hypothetical protein
MLHAVRDVELGDTKALINFGREQTEIGLQDMVVLNRNTQPHARIDDHP